MDSKIQIFKNDHFGSIRTIDRDGEVWFVGKDVAVALGYSNPQKAIRNHVDVDDRTVNESFTVNGTAPSLINESGLYALILSNKLPTVWEFKRWVTSEVISSVRKHGAYVIDARLTQLLSDPRGSSAGDGAGPREAGKRAADGGTGERHSQGPVLRHFCQPQ